MFDAFGVGSQLESHRVGGEVIPRGVSWPPLKRVPLTAEHAQAKLKAIRTHTLYFSDPVQNTGHQAYMESFVKSEEIFWNGIKPSADPSGEKSGRSSLRR